MEATELTTELTYEEVRHIIGRVVWEWTDEGTDWGTGPVREVEESWVAQRIGELCVNIRAALYEAGALAVPHPGEVHEPLSEPRPVGVDTLSGTVGFRGNLELGVVRGAKTP